MSNGLYLGKEVDTAGTLGPRLELDPTDLLTHGLIVGMTGSGKTGLAIALIEEVLSQGVPVLAIDPKGDLGDLLLLFDHLDAAAFEPWIDPDVARREGKDVKAAAEAQSAAWRQGLGEWGLSERDVAALRARREAVIYTPGSSAGVGLNVLQSLAAPAVAFASAEEDLRDEIAGIVSGLLGLVHIEADPLRSPDAIFLSTLVESYWRQGKGLSLEALIPAIAEPPFQKLGALPLESVYPRKQRQELMLALNGLLASPAFEAWRAGEPLDIDSLLRASDGRPRLSIVYTAHLSDEERMFVTALLLDKVKTWMRRQGGTTQLRALVYMDEIYGYFPPTENPPTKRPLLTLLKQARAQGVGIVLATQNPVDLDYKGLANIGTWLVGKLQTDQDRARLREGLLGSGLDAAALDRLQDATAKRTFLLHDIHRKAPCLLRSRCAMSYLRGPLTRDEITRLMHDGATAAAPRATPAAEPVLAAGPPVLPNPWRHNYLAKYGAESADPYLLVKYAVRYKGASEVVAVRAWSLDCASAAEVLESEPLELEEAAVKNAPDAPIRYAELPDYLTVSGVRTLDKALKERLPDKLAVKLWFDPVSKSQSSPGEAADAFALRLREADAAPAVARLKEKLAKKQNDLAAVEQELKGRKAEKWMAVGTAILSNIGLFSGRKRTISGAGTVLTKNRLENTAETRLAALQAEVAGLEQELANLTSVTPARFEERALSPARTDVKVLRSDLLWVY